MNWYKKAEFKKTDDIIYDIYKSIVDAVGGNWTVKPITEEKNSRVYWLQRILAFGLYGSDVIKKGDQFSAYVRIWTKRASGKVIHPHDGTYEGATNWDEGKLNPIKDYTDFATSGEELHKRWQAIYNLPPEDATKYDSEYGNRLFDIQIKLYGSKPDVGGIQSEYPHISTTSELDTPIEIAEHIKTEINRFYFGGDGDKEIEPLDPTSGGYTEPETTENLLTPSFAHNMNWYKIIKFAIILLPTETLDVPAHKVFEAIRLVDGRIIYDEYSTHWEIYYQNSPIIGKITNIESIGWLLGDGVYEAKYVGQRARDYFQGTNEYFPQ